MDSLFGVTLTTGEAVIANDPYSDTRRAGLPKEHPPMNSYLGLPLHIGERLVGMLGLANHPGGFSEDTIAFLEPLAVTIGQLIGAAGIQQLHREDQKSIARLSMVARQMTNGVLITDKNGYIEWVNDGFVRMTGYQPDELLGRRPRDVLHGPGTDAATEVLIREAMSAHESFSAELLAYDRAREGFWVALDSNPLLTGDGSVEGFMVMVTDISERKRVERMKSEFVSTISHELRTPLTSIAGALGLVAGGVAGPLPDKARDMVEIARKNSQRLTTLIDDLLDLEKLLEGGIPRRVRDPGPHAGHRCRHRRQPGLCRPVHGQHRLRRARRGGARRRRQPARAPDHGQPRCRTPRSSPPPGARSRYASRRIGLTARVEVRDHGPGIPDAFRGRIFEKFSQADASDSRLRGGTGLGLAISKELVERMGGSIGYESEHGAGATFYFDLPIAAEWPRDAFTVEQTEA